MPRHFTKQPKKGARHQRVAHRTKRPRTARAAGSKGSAAPKEQVVGFVAFAEQPVPEVFDVVEVEQWRL